MNYNHQLGIHLKPKTSILDIVEQLEQLEIATFQFFLTPSTKTNRYFSITEQDARKFRTATQSYANKFVHSSYWINLADKSSSGTARARYLMDQEIIRGRMLGITNFVIHPGNFMINTDHTTETAATMREEGCRTVARNINYLAERYPDITIILENGAQPNTAIGSRLDDFAIIRADLVNHERVQFCFDTAHAFLCGYALSPHTLIIEQLDKTIGLNNLKLIHWNDSHEGPNSTLDRHALPGHGTIGLETLLEFATDPRLCNVPFIIEPPPLSSSTQQEILIFLKQALLRNEQNNSNMN